MKEVEIERLMKEYGDAVGPSGRRQVVRKGRRRVWIPVTGGAMAALLIAGLLLWPSYAVAQTVQRVNLALKSAATMERVSYMKLPSGWTRFARLCIKGSWMRTESTGTTSMRGVFVHRDGKLLTNYDALDHASLTPARSAPPEVFDADLSPLDFATQSLKCATGAEDMSTQEHESINGREAYQLNFSGRVNSQGETWTGSLVVDAETNLPIEATFRQYHEKNGWTEFREEYKFNLPLDDSLFALDGEKARVDVWASRKELQDEWAGRNLGELDGTRIHDATVTSDGTIWMVISHAGNVAPTWIEDEHHQRYVSTYPFDLGFEVAGRPAIALRFVPVEAGAPKPGRISVIFSNRDLRLAGKEAEAGERLDGPLSIRLESASGVVPEFADRIGQDRSLLHWEMARWQVLGKYLEDQGKTRPAAEAYERYANARYRWVKYSAYEPLLDAARCYRSLGEIVKADELTRRSNALHAALER